MGKILGEPKFQHSSFERGSYFACDTNFAFTGAGAQVGRYPTLKVHNLKILSIRCIELA
jgi:hypothetical protein